MSLFKITLISAGSILLPIFAIIFRLGRLKTRYLPMALLIAVGAINEVTSILIINNNRTTSVNGNFYVLFELITIIWLFKNLRLNISLKFLNGMAITGFVVWILDNLVLHSLHSNNSLFRLVSSLFITYLAMDKVNQTMIFLINNENRKTDLLICFGLLLYFPYKAFVETFHVFTIKMGYDFTHGLWFLIAVVNMIMNLIFTLAILCIKPKQQFTSHLFQS
jgi:hypothetical protein